MTLRRRNIARYVQYYSSCAMLYAMRSTTSHVEECLVLDCVHILLIKIFCTVYSGFYTAYLIFTFQIKKNLLSTVIRGDSQEILLNWKSVTKHSTHRSVYNVLEGGFTRLFNHLGFVEVHFVFCFFCYRVKSHTRLSEIILLTTPLVKCEQYWLFQPWIILEIQ